MDIQKGDIVQSMNGRDQGKALFAVDVDGAYVILVDGKGRKFERPKRKKLRHITFLSRDGSRVSEKLRAGEKVTNSEVRRAIAAFRNAETASQSDDDETGGG